MAVGEGQSGNESNFPTFEFNEEGVREVVEGAIALLVKNAQALARMKRDPSVREHKFNEAHKRMLREEIGVASACVALDIVAPRSDPQSENGWEDYVNTEAERRLNPGPMPQPIADVIGRSMPDDL